MHSISVSAYLFMKWKVKRKRGLSMNLVHRSDRTFKVQQLNNVWTRFLFGCGTSQDLFHCLRESDSFCPQTHSVTDDLWHDLHNNHLHHHRGAESLAAHRPTPRVSLKHVDKFTQFYLALWSMFVQVCRVQSVDNILIKIKEVQKPFSCIDFCDVSVLLFLLGSLPKSATTGWILMWTASQQININKHL